MSKKKKFQIEKRTVIVGAILGFVLLGSWAYNMWSGFNSGLHNPTTFVLQNGDTKSIIYRNSDINKVKIPEDLPQNFLIYPNVLGNFDYLTGGSNPGLSVESTDNIKHIKYWFEEKLPENGWRITSQSGWNEKTYDIFFDNDLYEGHIVITNVDHKNDSNITSPVRIHEYIKKKM